MGLRCLVRRRKEEGLVIYSSEKFQTCGILSEEEWIRSMEPHTREDPVVDLLEVDAKEK